MKKRPIRKVLIANRGEIACRIMRTLRKLGIRSVAVYSDADRHSLHVEQADEAVWIGKAPATDSYLNIGKVLQAAQSTGADAIHPGYGFLSENPDFARACEAAGMVFIGPAAQVMEVMGRKDAAKARMEDAGVPVIPGYHGEGQETGFLTEQATTIGFPVLIKARAGGGGKGMRLVETVEEFADSLASARAEAQASFGDDRVLVEKYIHSTRHIEFQIFGDTHGNVVHLFERDCSLQRRYQKVIEESPAPGMTDIMRDAMGRVAVQVARAVDYVGAGTVEFVVDGSQGLRPDRFWFLEMNTRLQVEHPVTEAITGLDLVAWQIAVAEGESLPLTQQEITPHGHAMEARIYAEDPDRSFLPATGTLTRLELCDMGRVETGVRQGDRITSWYDPMIAKVIVHGPDRAGALGRLRTALEHSLVVGCRTNLRFLARLCAFPRFVEGDVETGLIAREAEYLAASETVPPEILSAAAIMILFAGAGTVSPDPWDDSGYWRLWDQAEIGVSLNGQEVRVTIQSVGRARVCIGSWEGDCIWSAARFERIEVNGSTMALQYHLADREILIAADQQEWTIVIDDAGFRSDEDEDSTDRVTAPMPGMVTRIAVQAGDPVEESQLLLVMEAMKMEHTLRAPRDGEVASVHVRPGDQVYPGDDLLDLKPISPETPDE